MTLPNQHRFGKLFVSCGHELVLVVRAGTLRWRALVLSAGLVLVSSAALAVSATRNASQTCVGDCDNTSQVTVDEIVTGVSIALGSLSLDRCPRFDCDGTGQVTVDCLVKAVDAALNGCDSGPTASPTPTPANVATPESTPSATRPAIDEAALAASVRIASEPILRLFDFQARVGTPGGVPGRSTGAGCEQFNCVSGCQQFNCIAQGRVTGTEEDCCFDRQFTQVFDNCIFDDDLGRVVSLNGTFVLNSDSFKVCTGAIPVAASFTASLSSFTHDVSFPDGSFSRTFQDLTESFEVTTGGCTVRQPEPLGFGVRGDGRRIIDGELQQFQSDGAGHVLVDSESDVHALEIAVGSTGEPDACTVTAALNGSLTGADFRGESQFSTVFTDFQVVQRQTGALLLGLNGTIDTDCLGAVTLSTGEPLRLAPGDTCFTAGRVQAQLADGTVSATYTASGLDLDFGADGSADQHFAACTDLPAGPCRTKTVGLCGACTALDQCQEGLSCFPCSRNCSDDSKRCSPSDTFVTCEDGVF